MFKQLVSNLPFNPSLLSQLSFYAGRLRQEASFRRLGFICLILAMLIQMIAVISPPERSLAASANHIINGLNTRDDMLRAWDRPGSDIPAIYGYFGLTRQDIAGLTMHPNVTIRSNDGNDWWTTGRHSLSGRSDVQNVYKENELTIKAGSSTVYMRQLRAWDIRNPYNTYRAWKGTKADGTAFWILEDCGNYTQVGKIPPKRPRLELRKTVKGNPGTLKPGDQLTFQFEWRNTVPDSLAENVVLHDQLNLDYFTIVSPSNLNMSGKQLTHSLGNVGYSSTFKVLNITVKLKNPLAHGLQVCNAASLTANNASVVRGGPACVTIKNPPPPPPPSEPKCPYDSSLPASSSDCVVSVICSSLDSVIKPSTRQVTFTAKATSTNQSFTTIKSYVYDFGDDKSQTVNSSAYSNQVTHEYETGNYTASVVINYSYKDKNGSTVNKTVTCVAPIEFETEKPVGETKTVKNVTQNLEGDAAVNSVVRAGDVLEYTLTTINSQRYNQDNYVIEDYIGDILDYADLDLAALQASGGRYDDETKKISWPNQSIKAFSEVEKTFRVTIKNPIPSTNAPSTVGTAFDCKISNRYGNEIGMQVACPAVKGIETLPNTGPGTSLTIGFTITTIVGYFFARSRLLAKELELVKVDYRSAGA